MHTPAKNANGNTKSINKYSLINKHNVTAAGIHVYVYTHFTYSTVHGYGCATWQGASKEEATYTCVLCTYTTSRAPLVRFSCVCCVEIICFKFLSFIRKKCKSTELKLSLSRRK